MTKIENEEQYRWALQRVEELLPKVNDDTPLKDPCSIELELLSGLVADYSDEHYSIGEPSLIDIMKLRMYEMGLSQLALSKLLGINPSRICEYLSGKRERLLSREENENYASLYSSRWNVGLMISSATRSG